MRLICVALVGLVTGVATADDLKPKEAAAANAEATAISDADLGELIKQLNADRYSQRQSATKRLAEAGPSIIPKLVEAAEKGPTESAARIVDVLEQHWKGDDEQTKQSAEKALKRLAKNNKANVSRFARQALGETVPDDTDADRREVPNNNPPPPFRFGNGQFKIQLQVRGGGHRVTRRNVNGVKDATIEENGKQIKIHEEPSGKVKVTVTEDDENGEKKTKEYESESLDELKKNHPRAHQLYQQYGVQNGVGPNPFRHVPGVAPRQAAQAAELRRLKRIIEQLKETNLKEIDEETRASLQEQLDRLQQELKSE